MRVLGFSQDWPKLQNEIFTTFRFARKDRDWQIGEYVQIVFRPRSPQRESLGIAQIIAKEPRRMAKYGRNWEGDDKVALISESEAIADGFAAECPGCGQREIAYSQMWEWLFPIYGLRLLREPMNKLTLKWISKEHRKRL